MKPSRFFRWTRFSSLSLFSHSLTAGIVKDISMIMMEKDSVAGVKQILIRDPKRPNERLKAQKSNSLPYTKHMM